MSKTNILSHDISWRLKCAHDDNVKDKYVKMYRKYKTSKKPEYIGDSILIYRNSGLKLILESMLLAGCTEEECIEYFGCDVESIKFYKMMFFDIDPIITSKAKLNLIANDGRPNEVSFKLCAIKFGKNFLKWHLGLINGLDEEDIKNIDKRLKDSIKLKSLGNELVDSDSPKMDQYIRMIKMVREETKYTQDNGGSSGLGEIMNHFSKFFDRKEEN